MSEELNYYSRYNRIKVQDKKSLPSLYSLLNINILTKLAQDATISLQMISLYKKSSIEKTVLLTQQEGHENQYLKSNIKHQTHSQSHSIDSRMKGSVVNVHKRKSKLSKQENKSLQRAKNVERKLYLENLVRQVREKSKQRIKQSEQLMKQEKKKKKKKPQTTRRSKDQEKFMQDSKRFEQQIFQQNNQPQNEQNQQDLAKQRHQKHIQNNFIKSFLQQSPLAPDNKAHTKNKQYVESVQDQNQPQQKSKPSVVIGRLNLNNQSEGLTPNLIRDLVNRKVLENQSKEDNPSSREGKESDIRSFSKQQSKKRISTKNLISLQLTHSQSQVFQPQERSLDIVHKQEQNQTHCYENLEFNRHAIKMVESQHVPQHVQQEIFNKNKQVEQNQSSPFQNIGSVAKSLNNIIQTDQDIADVGYLSQLNPKKQVQDPPDNHPLQSITEENQGPQFENFVRKIINKSQNPNKTSFKKFMTRKQLNPRLVTSTILNQKNASNKNLREHLNINQQTENEYKKPQQIIYESSSMNHNSREKSEKKNFKKLCMKKKQKVQDSSVPKKQDITPLRKLQNQKLLLGFFNDN